MHIAHFPNSTNLEWGIYLEQERLMLLKFKSTKSDVNRLYAYSAIPFEVWRTITQAESPGSAFASEVRSKFKVTRLI